MVKATKEDLSLCPGFGPQKVSMLTELFIIIASNEALFFQEKSIDIFSYFFLKHMLLVLIREALH